MKNHHRPRGVPDISSAFEDNEGEMGKIFVISKYLVYSYIWGLTFGHSERKIYKVKNINVHVDI